MKQTIGVIKNPFVWIGGILLGVCYVFGVIPDFLHKTDTDFLYFLEVTTGIGIVTRVIPLVTVLAYGLEFYREWDSNYYRMKLIRMGKIRYWISHVSRAYFSGCFIMILALLLFFAVGTGIRGEFKIDDGIEGMAIEGTLFFRWISEGKGYRVLLVKCISQILSGGLWPVLAIAVSTFLRNPYIPLITPFAACLLSEILGVVSGNIWVSLQVFYYLFNDLLYRTDNGIIWILCEIIILFLSFSLLLLYGMNRRLKTDG